ERERLRDLHGGTILAAPNGSGAGSNSASGGTAVPCHCPNDTGFPLAAYRENCLIKRGQNRGTNQVDLRGQAENRSGDSAAGAERGRGTPGVPGVPLSGRPNPSP